MIDVERITTLEEAEQALEETQTGVGAGKIRVAKIVKRIREDQLYTSRVSKATNAPCVSLDAYLLERDDDFRRLSGLGPRRVRQLLKSYLIYCDQLGYGEDWLLAMGEHAYILADATNTKNYELQDDDVETPTGKRLGRSSFSDTLGMVEAQVRAGTQRVVETTALVADIVGKTKPIESQFIAHCRTLDEDRVQVDRLQVTFDGVSRTFGPCSATWPMEELRAWASKAHVRLEGLDEPDLADAHLH